MTDTPHDPLLALIAKWRKKSLARCEYVFHDCASELEAALSGSAGRKTDRHVDMLQVDRLRAWARNIREHGANITHWGDPVFVSDEMDRIAADIEAQVKADNALPAQPVTPPDRKTP